MARWLWLLELLRPSLSLTALGSPPHAPSVRVKVPTIITRIRMEIDEPGSVGVPVPWPRYHSGGPDLKRSPCGLQAAGWRTRNKSRERTLFSLIKKLIRLGRRKIAA